MTHGPMEEMASPPWEDLDELRWGNAGGRRVQGGGE